MLGNKAEEFYHMLVTQRNLAQKIILCVIITLLFIIIMVHNPFSGYTTKGYSDDRVKVDCIEYMGDQGWVSRPLIPGVLPSVLPDSIRIYDNVGIKKGNFLYEYVLWGQCFRFDGASSVKARKLESLFVWNYWSRGAHVLFLSRVLDVVIYFVLTIFIGIILILVFKDTEKK